MGVGDRRCDRLVDFMGNRSRQLPHRRDAVRVRQLHLHRAITPLAFTDFRLCPLTLGDVHVGSDKFNNFADGGVNRMTYFRMYLVAPSGRTIRKTNSNSALSPIALSKA